MEKITKKEFLKRCVDAEASTNVDSLTKEIVRSEIFVFDYYLEDNKPCSVIGFDGEDIIIAGYEEEFKICASNSDVKLITNSCE